MGDLIYFRRQYKPAGGTLRLLEHTTKWIRRLQYRWQLQGINYVNNVVPLPAWWDLAGHKLTRQEVWRIFSNGDSEEDILQALSTENEVVTMEEIFTTAQIVYYRKLQAPLSLYNKSRSISHVYKVDSTQAQMRFNQVKQERAHTHEEVLMFHGSHMASSLAIVDWGFIDAGYVGGFGAMYHTAAPWFSNRSFYSMEYMKPWNSKWSDLTYIPNEEARNLAAAYETLYKYNRQLLTALPAPLLKPSARVILICRVLVPRENAARAHAWATPSASEPEYNLQCPAAYCCPDLLVHLE